MSVWGLVTWRAKLRKRELAHIPFAIEGETREHFVMTEHEPVVVDTFRGDQTESKIPEMIVIGGGNGELHA